MNIEQTAYVWRCPYHGNLRHDGWVSKHREHSQLHKVPIQDFGVVGKIGKKAFIISVHGMSRQELKEFAEKLLIGGCTWGS